MRHVANPKIAFVGSPARGRDRRPGSAKNARVGEAVAVDQDQSLLAIWPIIGRLRGSGKPARAIRARTSNPQNYG